MKKIIFAFTLLIVFAWGAAASDRPALDKLLETAERNSPVIAAAREKTARAEAALAEAGAKMGPKAGVAAGALWQENALSASVSLGGFGSITGSIGSRNAYGAAAGFIQTVYAGGSLYANRQAAALARDAAAAEETRTRQGVLNSVKLAYYARKRAEEKRAVAAEAVSLAESHLARAEKLYKSGVIAKNDVLRSKVAVADGELALIRATNAVEITLAALERATGAPVNAAEIADAPAPHKTLKELKTMQTAPAGDPVETAYENRAELKMYMLLGRQAEKVARAAQGQLLPQITAVGALMNVDDSFFPGGSYEWRVGLAAYWTLFDSGEIRAKTNQAKARARELLHLLDDMKNVVRMEVVQAELNLRSAEARLEVTERQTAESEEDYRIAVRRYEEQVGTNLDVLDARLALINSRMERVDALYDIETARAGLEFAIGK